jgi:hypothetical protein
VGRNSDTIKYHRMIDDGQSPSTKPCAGCHRWLPLEDFGKASSRKDGLNSLCRPCARAKYQQWTTENAERHKATTRAWKDRQGPSYHQDSHRRARYGMERGQYDRMVAAQHGTCAICEQVPTSRLVVDHCHGSNRVRDLLCDRCNHALHLIEQPDLLAAAIAYLEAHRDDDLPDQGMVGPAV